MVTSHTDVSCKQTYKRGRGEVFFKEVVFFFLPFMEGVPGVKGKSGKVGFSTREGFQYKLRENLDCH